MNGQNGAEIKLDKKKQSASLTLKEALMWKSAT